MHKEIREDKKENTPSPEKAKKETLKLDKALEADIFKILEQKYGVTEKEILDLAEKKKEKEDESFPSSILKQGLSGLEALTKYLRENKKLSYEDISKKLNRNPKSLATTYKESKEKHKEEFRINIDEEDIRIPFSVFQNNLSILESISVHLVSKGITISEAARILGKDPRTIWTVLNRAKKKLNESRIKGGAGK